MGGGVGVGGPGCGISGPRGGHVGLVGGVSGFLLVLGGDVTGGCGIFPGVFDLLLQLLRGVHGFGLNVSSRMGCSIRVGNSGRVVSDFSGVNVSYVGGVSGFVLVLGGLITGGCGIGCVGRCVGRVGGVRRFGIGCLRFAGVGFFCPGSHIIKAHFGRVIFGLRYLVIGCFVA